MAKVNRERERIAHERLSCVRKYNQQMMFKWVKFNIHWLTWWDYVHYYYYYDDDDEVMEKGKIVQRLYLYI